MTDSALLVPMPDGTGALALVPASPGAAVIDVACRDIPVSRTVIAPDGMVSDPRFTRTGAELGAGLLSHPDAISPGSPGLPSRGGAS